MIARSNLPRLRDVARSSARVLDVGGWFLPFNLATHVLDIGSFETRHKEDALDPEDEERFSAETWVIHDACIEPWPFPDKFFDFAICSHLLEDVRDPLAVCRQLRRVAKSGYLETPSRLREIYSKKLFFRLRSLLGKIPEVGFYHHRWFVEAEGSHLRFTEKVAGLLEDSAFYLTRAQVGRRLTEQESALAVWWENDFTFEEVFVDPRRDYPQFRRKALQQLKAQVAR
jgi:SAM-dependent methyltransferase